MSTTTRIDIQPWMKAPATVAVMDALGADGGDARFVGGCVRDAVLGRTVRDVDIATHEPPERVTALLERAGIKAVPTGIEHGTITAVVEKEHFEITTLRLDVKTHGRHADVAFTEDWAEDAARRDFTMNALSMDRDGVVHDPFGGLDDLAAGKVRFVGDPETRIREDVLRLLRYFRFHALYDKGEADEAALRAARALAPLLPGLSGERVWAELRRVLATRDPAAVFRLMDETDVLAEVLPEARRFDRLDALVRIEGLLGRALEDADPLLRLCAVVEAGEGGTAALSARLRHSGHDRDRLAALCSDNPGLGPGAAADAVRRAIYHLGNDLFRDAVLLSWAGAGGEAGVGFEALLDQNGQWPRPELPIRGSDALGLGLDPGPAVGRAVAAVEAWWIAEDFRPDRAACLEKLKAVTGGDC